MSSTGLLFQSFGAPAATEKGPVSATGATDAGRAPAMCVCGSDHLCGCGCGEELVGQQIPVVALEVAA